MSDQSRYENDPVDGVLYRIEQIEPSAVAEAVRLVGELFIVETVVPYSEHAQRRAYFIEGLTSATAFIESGLMPEDFLTTSKLKARGWSIALIKRFLPAPDKTATNPVYKSAAPIRLYAESRVAEIEATDAWQQARDKMAGRKAGARKAVATKQKQIEDYVDSLVIEMPQIEPDVLTRLACRSYNSRKLDLLDEQGHDFTEAMPDSSPAFLERIMVNYLRHRLTSYEDEMARIYGKVGATAGYRELRRKVYAAIGEAYPELKRECQRQWLARLDQENQ